MQCSQRTMYRDKGGISVDGLDVENHNVGTGQVAPESSRLVSSPFPNSWPLYPGPKVTENPTGAQKP